MYSKRLHYVLSVDRIHTRVFFSVNQIQTFSYDLFYDSHSSDANGQMTYYDWSILSIPSASLYKIIDVHKTVNYYMNAMPSHHYVGRTGCHIYGWSAR
jgi:hypothetical protein